LPAASVSAFLHAIMPAPDLSRSSFTTFAEMAAPPGACAGFSAAGTVAATSGSFTPSTWSCRGFHGKRWQR